MSQACRIVIHLVFIVVFIPAFSIAQSTRQSINIDTGWKFHFGHSANPDKDFNYSTIVLFAKSGEETNTAVSKKFPDDKWETVNLPHDWAVALPFVNVKNGDITGHGFKPVGGWFPETSIGWYRKHFMIDAADSNQRFQIQFDGIFRDANIWVNGFYVGNNKSGYTGNVYDITDYLHYGSDNVLVVRADATQYEGWFYEGAGIYRHVWLNKFDKINIINDGIFAYSTVQNNKATVTIETTLANQSLTSGDINLTAYLQDRSGKIIGTSKAQSVSLAVNENKTAKQLIQLSNPKLWSVDDPYLYRIAVEAKNGNTIVDRKEIRFGIRTVEIKANGVFLNGQHIKIKGVNNHQDHAGVGSALPDYLQYYRVRLLKDMGVNACRTSHHPPTPEFLDACDSLGMLVLDENRLLNSSPEYTSQLERLIKRDRSRACVFLWSIGNEEFQQQQTPNGKRIAQTLIAKQKELDPTRTCTYAADLGNVFRGINEVIPVRGFNYRESAVEAYHKEHPAQPILGTEMGSTVTTRGELKKDSIRAYVPDQDITAPWWASTAEKWWKLAADNDYWLGGFVWTGFDYRGEPTPFAWPNVNSHFGIMDMCGFPKNIYYYYQSWWTDKDVLHISPHWNLPELKAAWNEKEGKPVDVWINSNADNVELFLNGKSLGKKDMPRNGHLQWTVNYEPGKLEAIAYKKGKRLTAKVETTGAPAEVVITPYKTTMLADGKDATVINVSVVDKEGREVPDADNMIRFAIKGDGKIIGVGNGDPSSHEPDQCAGGLWQRSLFNGKCQVIVQSTDKAGAIQFEATAAGLWKGSTDIITVSPKAAATITNDQAYTLTGEAAKIRSTGKIIGADISFLPELEAKGIRFSDKGVQKDVLQILKEHGFNYIRLRIFNDPAQDSGYAPGKGFCNLAYTKQMAKRVKDAGLQLLLDFHYSDYWADPGKQYKPAAWKNLSFTELKKALYDYTKKVIQELKDQNTLPDMVQVGNEINHGMVWPDGSVQNPDGMAQLFAAGVAAVKAVNPATVIMLHIALGGQNEESKFIIDNMLARGVHFDVIGESYYPKWHGTLADLNYNLTDLAQRYGKDVIVVEYSQLKNEVNKIAFEVPGDRGRGAFIWEPLSTWESIFDWEGKANELLLKYDELAKEFLK